ncbi:class I SAM-dependent methyltransferase [Streptomyces sp. NPDC004362]|uniref:class I SAM-dependent DNA methyltransferase n=1 Tax=Streptomyces sp. NPDC004362 TaxID=3154456 RepID=UPI0033A81A95
MNHQEPDFVRTARLAYDAMAPYYDAHHPDTPGNRPLESALVGALADLVRANGPAPLADLGCGPGHVTARLQDLGVPVFGVDLSPRMVDLARRTHPGVRFHVGTMTALDLPPDTLGGIAALDVIDHVPQEHLTTAFDEFHRVLTPGGHALVRSVRVTTSTGGSREAPGGRRHSTTTGTRRRRSRTTSRKRACPCGHACSWSRTRASTGRARSCSPASRAPWTDGVGHRPEIAGRPLRHSGSCPAARHGTRRAGARRARQPNRPAT